MAIYNVNGVDISESGSGLKGKTILGIGDSITENNTTNNNKSWLEYLPEMLGVKVINDGKSGTGLIKGYAGFKSFCNRVDGTYVGTVNYDTINPDIILIMGNGNDSSGGAYYDYSANQITMKFLPVGNPTDTKDDLTVYGATRHIIDKLIQRYPTAHIGWILSTPRDQDLNENGGNFNDKGGRFDQYTVAIKAVCEEYRVPVLDMFHNSALRPDVAENAEKYFTDKKSVRGMVVHPTPEGIRECMIRPIAKWISANF